MAIEIIRNKRPLAPRIMLYGPNGIGKTTFLASVPGILLMPVEDGADSLDVARTPTPADWDEALDIISSLIADQQGFRALGIDSATKLQDLCYDAVCREAKVKSIEAIGYGKGIVRASELWQKLLGMLDELRKKMIIVVVAHAAVKRFEDPRLPAYDRYSPRLQVSSQGVGIGPSTVDWCDCVLHVNYRIYTDEKTVGAKERTTAAGEGERIMYAQERPAYIAKNRYNLPHEMEFSAVHLINEIKKAFVSTAKVEQEAEYAETINQEQPADTAEKAGENDN